MELLGTGSGPTTKDPEQDVILLWHQRTNGSADTVLVGRLDRISNGQRNGFDPNRSSLIGQQLEVNGTPGTNEEMDGQLGRPIRPVVEIKPKQVRSSIATKVGLRPQPKGCEHGAPTPMPFLGTTHLVVARPISSSLALPAVVDHMVFFDA